MAKVFLSYRRQDTQHAAGRLYDRLVDQLGAGSIFMDVDGVDPGVDFVSRIEEAVSSARVMLVLIGSNWLGKGDDGTRRIDQHNDFVRLEVANGLQHGLTVIPVLVEGASMPEVDALPPPLEPLWRRHALTLQHVSFQADAAKIIEAIAAAGAGDAQLSPETWRLRWGAYVAQLLLVSVFAVNGLLRVALNRAELVEYGWFYVERQDPRLILFVGVSQLVATLALLLPPVSTTTRWLSGLAAAGILLQMGLATVDHVLHAEFAMLSASTLVALAAGLVVVTRLIWRL